MSVEANGTHALRLSYAPVRVLMLYVTEDCNLRCPYCFVEKKPRRMTFETARKAVDFFLGREVSGSEYRLQINFFGGEPFLEPDLMEEVAQYARRRPNGARRIDLSATTNGTLSSPRIEDLVRKHRVSLLYSLDGGPEVTALDRPFVSGRSSYDVATRNLGRFLECSPDLLVRTTFHPGALDLVGRVEHLLGLGAPQIALCPVMDWSWEAHEEATEEAFARLGRWVLGHASEAALPPLEMTRRLLLDWHAHRSGAPRPRRPCQVGHSLLGVDPDGNVMPCHRFLYRPQDWFGTVERPELQTERRRRFVELDSDRMVACRRCEAEPVCGGGCRLVALQQGAGLDEPHPGHCIPMRAHTRMVARVYQALLDRGTLGTVLRSSRRSARPRASFILN